MSQPQQFPFPAPGQQPQAPAPQPQQYAPPAPPQGYQPPQFQAPTQAPQHYAENLGLDTFYDQPESAGQSLKIDQIGRGYRVRFPRAASDNDVRQQLHPQTKEPQWYADGRPKTVLVMPVQVIAAYLNGQPDDTGTKPNPEGENSWWLRGASYRALIEAITEAGGPQSKGVVEPGATADIIYYSDKPNGPGMSATRLVRVKYYRPEGAPQVTPQAVPQAAPQAAPQAVPQAAAQAVPQPYQPPQGANAEGITEAQQALFGMLGGQQAPTQPNQ